MMIDRREAIQAFLATTAAMGLSGCKSQALEIPERPWAAILKVPVRLNSAQKRVLLRSWKEVWRGLEPEPRCIVLSEGFDVVIRE